MWSFASSRVQDQVVEQLKAYVRNKGLTAVLPDLTYDVNRDYRRKNELKGLRYNPGYFDDYGLEVAGRISEPEISAPAEKDLARLEAPAVETRIQEPEQEIKKETGEELILPLCLWMRFLKSWNWKLLR